MSGVRALIEWNPPLVLALLAVVTVQLFKFTFTWVAKRRIDFRRLTGTGGMPSTHSASVAALTTSIGIATDWRSPLFSVTVFFSIIVLYDAAGVRREAGRQARVLNGIIDDLKAHHHVEGERLRELLGHTGLEVFIGVVYGVLLAVALHP